MAQAMDAELLARLEAHARLHDDLAMHDAEQAQWAADLREAAGRLRAYLAAERDCRTCRNFRGTQHCHSVLRCVDGSSYQRGGAVQLWETAPVDAGF